MRRKILLTFDVEEFDIPEEYKRQISLADKIEVGERGLQQVIQLIKPFDIRCTFFTTARFAEARPELIKDLCIHHEIASHGYDHSHFEISHLSISKQILENITGKQVYGYRMARLAPVDQKEIAKAGYTYNSSLNPTWIPGRYNHLNKPRYPYVENHILNIPTSVTPILRIPLFWLTIKNFPMLWIKHALKQTLNKDGFLSLYFHPWEFTETSGYGLPGYISNRNGLQMRQRLAEIIQMLKQEGEFITMQDFASSELA